MSKHFYILSDVNINVNKMSLEEIWIRIHLPMQGTRVQCLVWEDPTGRGETRPMHHDCWASAPEPTSCNYWARVPQLLKPGHLGPAVCNRRSQRSEKPVQHNEEQPPLATTRERPRKATEDSAQPGINDFLKKSWRHPSLCPSLLYILIYNIHLVLYYISHNMYFTGYTPYIFVVQSHSCVWLFATPWTAACQDPLSFTICPRIPCPSLSPDAIQPSHPLPSPSPPTFNLSQHQGVFQRIGSSHQAAKILELQLQLSVLQMNVQGWFPLGLTGLISLLFKGLSRVFSSTIVGKYQCFASQPSYTHIQTHIHV